MKTLYLLIFVLVVLGSFLIDRRIVVINEDYCLGSSDSSDFESIRRTFGNQSTVHTKSFISLYHMPTFGKKICYTFFIKKNGFETVRKEIIADSLIWGGRALNDSTNHGISIAEIIPSNQLSILYSQLQDVTEKKLKSERRVHLISRRPATFPDEDIWFLDFERNGNRGWAKWYNDSKKREPLQKVFFKVESLN